MVYCLDGSVLKFQMGSNEMYTKREIDFKLQPLVTPIPETECKYLFVPIETLTQLQLPMHQIKQFAILFIWIAQMCYTC